MSFPPNLTRYANALQAELLRLDWVTGTAVEEGFVVVHGKGLSIRVPLTLSCGPDVEASAQLLAELMAAAHRGAIAGQTANRRGVVTPELEQRFAEARERLKTRTHYRPGDGTWLESLRRKADRCGKLLQFENNLRWLVSLSEKR